MKNGHTRQIIRRLIFIFGAMVVLQVPTLLIHEAAHLMMAEALGGMGKINFDYLLPMIPIAGRVPFSGVSSALPVYLAGGLYAAVMPWLILWFIAWRTWERGDAWIEAIAASMILSQVFYAPGEYFLYINNMDLYWMHTIGAAILSQIIFYALYMRAIINWIDARAGKPSRKQASIEETAEKKRQKELKKLEKNGKN